MDLAIHGFATYGFAIHIQNNLEPNPANNEGNLYYVLDARPNYPSLKDYQTFLSADCETVARTWLDEVYEKEHRDLDENAGQKDWEYSTNINEETAAASVKYK